MAYKPSPRPVFDKPSHIPYAGVTRHLWGEEDAGLVDVATPDFFRSRAVSPSVGRLALRGGRRTAGGPQSRARPFGRGSRALRRRHAPSPVWPFQRTDLDRLVWRKKSGRRAAVRAPI